jgi:hypothetical protein
MILAAIILAFLIGAYALYRWPRLRPLQMGSADIDRMIYTSTAYMININIATDPGTEFHNNLNGSRNEMPIAGLQESLYSWAGGPDMAYGTIFRYKEPPNQWIPIPTGAHGVTADTYMKYTEAWMVFMHADGHDSSPGAMDLKQVSLQIWRADNNRWEWLFRNAWQIVWSPRWAMGPNNNGVSSSAQGFLPGALADYVPDLDQTNRVSTITIDPGGVGSRDDYRSNACHFTIGGFDEAGRVVQFADLQRYLNPYNIRGWLLSCRVRRSAGSGSGHQGLVHLSHDPKYFNYPHGGGTYYPPDSGFPNAAISMSIALTPQWQDLYAGPWAHPNALHARNVDFNVFRTRAFRPLNPW